MSSRKDDGPVFTPRPAHAPATTPSQRHPDGDVLGPAYSPGSVPEPKTDEKGNPGHADSAYPPKRPA